MADPQRLLSSIGDADDLERELLASIQSVEPPTGAKGEAWAQLSAQVAAVGLVGTTHGPAAAASGAVAAPGASAGAGAAVGWAPAALNVLGGKLGLGLAVAATAIGASTLWVQVHREGPAPNAPVKSAISASALQPPLVAPARAEASADVMPAPASASMPEVPGRPGVEQARKDRLSTESALLTRARAELRRGDATKAQQTLTQLRAQFPKGVLGQEREVLNIEVLAARGNKEAARRMARAFIAAYPKSPHSAQLTRFAEAQ